MNDNQRNGAEDSDFRALLEASFSENLNLKKGEIRKGTILQVGDREVIVDLGAKLDGVVPSTDLERLDPSVRDGLRVGQTVPVYILNPGGQDENLIVSINMGLQQYDWEKARELMTSEDPTEVVVKGHNRGGILVHWERLEGFIPSSHLVTTAGTGGRESWDELLSTELVVKVIEVDQARRRLIFSEREAQREQRAMHKARLLAELNEGDKVRGRVTGLRDFGAFVNLGGADGLIHVSELAWHRVDHPRDVLKVGDEIEVYVLSLDRSSNRIALSRKRLLQDPWETASEVYHEGQLIEGTVTNVVDFGAFVALDNGLEGLLHLSEMGDGSLKEPYSYLKKGDRLQLRISHLEPEKRRVGFTQRWGTEAPPQAGPANAAATEEVATEEAALAENAAPEELINNAEPAEGPAPGEETPSPSPEALAADHVKDDAPVEGAPDIVEDDAPAESTPDAADDATTMMALPPKSEENQV
jgi:small subunit ribosomal protein S1